MQRTAGANCSRKPTKTTGGATMQDPYINPVINHDEILRILIDLQKQDIERLKAEKIQDNRAIDRSILNFN